MTNIQLVILSFISAFVISLVVHECGHFVVAKRLGVTVISVLIGIGPRLFGWVDRQNVSWQVFALPICGFNVLEVNKADADLRPQALRLIAVFAGGPVANFLLSAIAFFLAFAIWGASYTPPDVTVVEPGSPAERAGIRPGDSIVSINGVAVGKMTDIAGIIQQQPQGAMPVDLINDGQKRSVVLSPLYLPMPGRLGPDRYSVRVGVFYIGVPLYEKLSWQAALRQAAEYTGNIVLTPVHELLTVVSHGPPKEINTSPATVEHHSEQRPFKMVDFLMMLAILSANFGIVNLYPIFRFDGGQIVLATGIFVLGRQPTGIVLWFLRSFGAIMVCLISILIARDHFVQIGILR